jgi:hypothetical protein
MLHGLAVVLFYIEVNGIVVQYRYSGKKSLLHFFASFLYNFNCLQRLRMKGFLSYYSLSFSIPIIYLHLTFLRGCSLAGYHAENTGYVVL